MILHRRSFLKTSSLFAASLGLPNLSLDLLAAEAKVTLPKGNAPQPVALPHFPDRLHGFVWRNWTLVPISKLAKVLQATPEQVRALGESMGLPQPGPVTDEQLRRSYITIIRRNWHLIPYEQLLLLLDWTPEHMAYMLREDDFLYIKLGSLKPKCAPLKYAPPAEAAAKRARDIAEILKTEIPEISSRDAEPLFSFVSDLSTPLPVSSKAGQRNEKDAPRFCYSYFALYGDPLLEPELDPYPDGYLERLAKIGVKGVWLQAVLHKLAPFPWLSEDEKERTKRLHNLRALVKRASHFGIGVYLYLNEPRAMPQAFFKSRPEMKGVSQGDYAALCTSDPQVRKAISDAVTHVCSAVPELAGFFTISGSENLTNCWSHGNGNQCPRCGKRSPAEVIAEINTVFYEGIQQAQSKADLLVWDWGWRDEWVADIIQHLPSSVALMSVSEWSIPVKRGGIDSVVGEYSISTVGPGPRASKHWELARKRGLRVIAKIQAGNTWELSSTPYIPALENVARHAARLKEAGVDGLMLGWTLGGYPSPNLHVACEISMAPWNPDAPIDEVVQKALQKIATERFGSELAPAVVRAWKLFSKAFSEFPYHGGLVYNAPMQFGPSNLLWAQSTGYRATMIGFPYDDLEGWRQIYPPDVFIGQFTKIADGFDSAIEMLTKEAASIQLSIVEKTALEKELGVASAAAIHFRSTANQARFVQLREKVKDWAVADEKTREEMRTILASEISLAKKLFKIQRQDSRIGFEATNHYYYVGQDLLEKIVNCRHLAGSWLDKS